MSRLPNAHRFVAALLGVGLLAACGGGPSTASAPGKPVNITFWGWTRGSAQVVQAFNASHQDVHVTFEQIPSGAAGGYAKLFNAAKAGNEPDVFNVEYPMLPSFVSQGMVQNITSQVRGMTADYSPQTIQLTTLGGQNWGCRWTRRPRCSSTARICSTNTTSPSRRPGTTSTRPPNN